MTQDTTKKNTPENEETVRDIFDTFNDKQRLVLNYLAGRAFENEDTIKDILGTFNEKQRLVLYYIVGKAAEEANGREAEARRILGRILEDLGL